MIHTLHKPFTSPGLSVQFLSAGRRWNTIGKPCWGQGGRRLYRCWFPVLSWRSSAGRCLVRRWIIHQDGWWVAMVYRAMASGGCVTFQEPFTSMIHWTQWWYIVYHRHWWIYNLPLNLGGLTLSPINIDRVRQLEMLQPPESCTLLESCVTLGHVPPCIFCTLGRSWSFLLWTTLGGWQAMKCHENTSSV